ncbi:hypothetical protein CK203_098949 [Vitis vinifera]|uniref:Uncharacterized protein n=1 Tax=Vitis vinifera TaxID=29760 RepID=A0A438CV72_VITVI|nr:hypothetical protein CK203_098949 [Vitis vinifera]
MRKIWPLQDNCIQLKDKFASCEFGTPTCEIKAYLAKWKWNTAAQSQRSPTCESDFATCKLGAQRAKMDSKLRNQLARFSQVTMQQDERLGSSSLGVKKASYFLRAFEGKSKVKDHLEWQMLGERHEPLRDASENSWANNKDWLFLVDHGDGLLPVCLEMPRVSDTRGPHSLATLRVACIDLAMAIFCMGLQMNGTVEAANKNIKRILRRMVETSRDWSKKLPFVLWAYRTSFRTSTRATPYSLVYGMEAVLSVEIEMGSLRVSLEQQILEAD